MWGGALGEVDKWEELYKRQVQFASLAGADWHIGPCASVAEQFVSKNLNWENSVVIQLIYKYK